MGSPPSISGALKVMEGERTVRSVAGLTSKRYDLPKQV
jgi:hypothetical protein